MASISLRCDQQAVRAKSGEGCISFTQPVLSAEYLHRLGIVAEPEDVANYGKRDIAAIESRVRYREMQVAKALSSLSAINTHNYAIWLFCIRCGHRRVTSVRYLAPIVREPVDAVAELEQRLWCTICKEPGLRMFATPWSLEEMTKNWRKSEQRALILTRDDSD